MPFSVSHYHLVKSLKEKKKKGHFKWIAKPLVYYAPKNGNNTKHNTKDVKIHTKTLIGIA